MVTKRQVLDALNTMTFEDVTLGDVTVTAEDFREYIEKSIVQIDARNAKAAERQAEKKAAGDQLRSRIKSVLSDSPMTIADIVEALDDETVTNAMVVARLGQLVKNGEVNKNDVKVEGRTLKTYVLA